MDENDALGVNSTDTNKNSLMSALPENTMDRGDMTALDIKPELLDLSDDRPRDVKFGHRQATKACQTEITICDEFWNVCYNFAPFLMFFAVCILS